MQTKPLARYAIDAKTATVTRCERREDGVRVERAYDAAGTLVAEDVATVRVWNEGSTTCFQIDAPHEDFWFAKEALKRAGGRFSNQRNSAWRLAEGVGARMVEELRREGFVIENALPVTSATSTL